MDNYSFEKTVKEIAEWINNYPRHRIIEILQRAEDELIYYDNGVTDYAKCQACTCIRQAIEYLSENKKQEDEQL